MTVQDNFPQPNHARSAKRRALTSAASTTGLALALAGSLFIPQSQAAPVPAATNVPAATAPHYENAAFSTRIDTTISKERRQIHEQQRSRRARRDRRQARRRHAGGSMGTEPQGSPQQIAEAMVAQHGWDDAQWTCLDDLWERESGWDVTASNLGSGAYGIPQALPGDKMAAAGPDWQSDPATQIRWGLGYIEAEYGTPCGALEHSEAYGYY